MTTRLLLVDDDPRLREVVRYTLAREGFAVDEAGDGEEALAKLAQSAVDLVVLDVVMPRLDGIGVCRAMRARGDRTPVIFLSSRGEEVDRVLGLDLGGDDYLTKPFSPRELASRVRAVLRRAAPVTPSLDAAADVIEAGDLRIDRDHVRVTVAGRPVELTRTELNLLGVLASRPGRVFSRDELMDRAYEGRHFVSGRTLDSHVRNLRQKLREVGADDRIETVPGFGYRLAEV